MENWQSRETFRWVALSQTVLIMFGSVFYARSAMKLYNVEDPVLGKGLLARRRNSLPSATDIKTYEVLLWTHILRIYLSITSIWLYGLLRYKTVQYSVFRITSITECSLNCSTEYYETRCSCIRCICRNALHVMPPFQMLLLCACVVFDTHTLIVFCYGTDDFEPLALSSIEMPCSFAFILLNFMMLLELSFCTKEEAPCTCSYCETEINQRWSPAFESSFEPYFPEESCWLPNRHRRPSVWSHVDKYFVMPFMMWWYKWLNGQSHNRHQRPFVWSHVDKYFVMPFTMWLHKWLNGQSHNRHQRRFVWSHVDKYFVMPLMMWYRKWLNGKSRNCHQRPFVWSHVHKYFVMPLVMWYRKWLNGKSRSRHQRPFVWSHVHKYFVMPLTMWYRKWLNGKFRNGHQRPFVWSHVDKYFVMPLKMWCRKWLSGEPHNSHQKAFSRSRAQFSGESFKNCEKPLAIVRPFMRSDVGTNANDDQDLTLHEESDDSLDLT